MKPLNRRSRSATMSHASKRSRRGDGRQPDPAPGWPGHEDVTAFVNPRPPAVPATLNITLDEYFATASLMGLISASKREPNKQWVKKWSFEMGELMAAESARRRRKR